VSISFCPFCGSVVQEGYIFCKNCGADLLKKVKVTKTRFSGSIWLGALVGIVVMILLGEREMFSTVCFLGLLLLG
jgi:predicted nucleic acid-binding Zn ribbon protein